MRPNKIAALLLFSPFLGMADPLFEIDDLQVEAVFEDSLAPTTGRFVQEAGDWYLEYLSKKLNRRRRILLSEDLLYELEWYVDEPSILRDVELTDAEGKPVGQEVAAGKFEMRVTVSLREDGSTRAIYGKFTYEGSAQPVTKKIIEVSRSGEASSIANPFGPVSGFPWKQQNYLLFPDGKRARVWVVAGDASNQTYWITPYTKSLYDYLKGKANSLEVYSVGAASLRKRITTPTLSRAIRLAQSGNPTEVLRNYQRAIQHTEPLRERFQSLPRKTITVPVANLTTAGRYSILFQELGRPPEFGVFDGKVKYRPGRGGIRRLAGDCARLLEFIP